MKRLIPLLCFLPGCKGIAGAAIGGGVGAVTGTPQGVGVGAAAGFAVGIWNDFTTMVSNWWHSLWGSTPQVPPPTASGRIWVWLVLLAIFGLIVKFGYHFVLDQTFRASVFKLLKPRLHHGMKAK